MAYQAVLLNRLAQFGKVSYDLVVSDDAGIEPTYRHSISINVENDTPARRTQIRTIAVNRATNDRLPATRRQVLQDLIDDLMAAYQALLDHRAAMIARRDAGDY